MRRAALLIAGLLALVVAAVVAIQINASDPLMGETHHDFGDVKLGLQPEVAHTFHLTNRRSESLMIMSVRPTCGCVSAPRDSLLVDIGGTVDIPIRMRPPAGEKEVLIRLDLGGHGVQVLTVRATGHLPSTLSSDQLHVQLEPGAPQSITIHANLYEQSNPPSSPEVRLPPGVTAEFQGWNVRFQPADLVKAPAVYDGTLALHQDGAEIINDADLRISLPGVQELVLPINPNQVPSPATRPELINIPEPSAVPGTQAASLPDGR